MCIRDRPWAYRLLTGLVMRAMKLASGGRGRFRRLPLASGWTDSRDFPAPEGRTFMAQWKSRPKVVP